MRPTFARAKAKLRLFAGIAGIVAILWGMNQYWDWLVTVLWVWLGETPDGNDESNSATVRNVGLVIAAAIALPLALWRSVVGWRQADTAQRSLLNERYQKGAEMLGNEVLSVRLGGIYALQQLAQENPGEFHIRIMKLFCAFARHPVKDVSITPAQREQRLRRTPLRQDVQAIMDIIINRSESLVAVERSADYRLDLRGAVLQGIIVAGANLSRANLSGADLSGGLITERTNLSCAIFVNSKLGGIVIGGNSNLYKAQFLDAILIGAKLFDVNLSCANLTNAKLSGAELAMSNLCRTIFEVATLSSALFTDVRNLTEAQLRHTLACRLRPPGFVDVLDAQTGKPFVWSGHYFQRKDKASDGN